MPSSAPQAQQELANLLDTALPLPVEFMRAGKRPDANQLVWVLPVRNYRRAPGEPTGWIEEYDVAVRIEAFAPGEDTGAEVDQARWDLIDTVDTVLAQSNFMGYRDRGSELAVVEETLTPYDKGWVASSVVTASVEHRMR